MGNYDAARVVITILIVVSYVMIIGGAALVVMAVVKGESPLFFIALALAAGGLSTLAGSAMMSATLDTAENTSSIFREIERMRKIFEDRK